MGQSSPCDILKKGIDLETKMFRIELAPKHFFNFTPPQIKNELREGNLISCKGQIVQIEDRVSLYLNLKVNSLQALEKFGSIQEGHILKVVFIDGKERSIKCSIGSVGTIDQDGVSYVYPVGYTLSKQDIRILQKKEIDKIGLQWSSGYEEYTIYEVDFLMNQLSCLNQSKLVKPN